MTFEKLVKPALLKLRGEKRTVPPLVRGYCTHDFQNGSRLHFVRARDVSGKGRREVTPLRGQGSHMIGELANANALLQVEPNARLKKNQRVSAQIIGEG